MVIGSNTSGLKTLGRALDDGNLPTTPKVGFEEAMKTPDVIATDCRDVALLEPQTHAAARWLSTRCESEFHNIHDQIWVDACDEGQIIKELKGAGFRVIQQRGW